jgi:hypothetical protein
MQIDKLVSNHFETKGNPQMKRLMVFKISGKNRPQDASDRNHQTFSTTHIPSKYETYTAVNLDTNGKNYNLKQMFHLGTVGAFQII